MAVKSFTVRLLSRTDTASNWTSADPVLEAGEFGYDSTNKKFKCGDGTTAWSSLQYVATGEASGDMARLVYDTNNDGIVDNAAALNGHLASEFLVVETTGTAVDENPVNADTLDTYHASDFVKITVSEGQSIAKAPNNVNYATAQLRNVVFSTTNPETADGQNGDIWIKYAT